MLRLLAECKQTPGGYPQAVDNLSLGGVKHNEMMINDIVVSGVHSVSL